jgi:hypothetical protein
LESRWFLSVVAGQTRSGASGAAFVGPVRQLTPPAKRPTLDKNPDRPIYDNVGVPPEGKDPQYQLTGRWTNTASGPTGGTGTGMTLTYSIAPDSLSIPGGIGEPTSANVFTARMNAIYAGGMATWLPIVQQVFAEWSAINGVTYVYQPTDDGAVWGSAGVLGVRGDVRISSHPIDGGFNTLAYNMFPSGGGDMVIDSNDLQSGGFMFNTGSNSLRLRNVMAHEHGHGLGLLHTDPLNNTKLMESNASLAFDGPQFDDMLAVQRQYGDFFEKGSGNNTAANATNRGTLGNGTDTLSNISTSTTSDQDWYKFTITDSKLVNVTVAPAGPAPYLQGPQGGATSLFDPKMQADLQVQVLASDGTSVLATANATGLGANEALNNLNLSAGTYYIKVIDQAGSPNFVQAYQLTTVISVGGTPVTGSIIDISPDPRATPVDAVSIDFSEAIDPSTFSVNDLTLTRDGNSVDLTTATLTSADNIHWTLGNLGGLTDRVGTFALTLPPASVLTTDFRALSTSDSDSWLMTGIYGTSGDDVVRISRTGVINVFINNATATPDYTFSLSGLPSLSMFGGDGNDTLIIDLTGGAPFPTTAGVQVDGGAHTTSDTLRVVGSSTAITYNVPTATQISAGAANLPINFTNMTGLEFFTGNFTVQQDLNHLDVSFGTNAKGRFNVAQHLDALALAAGAQISVIIPGGNSFLSVTDLSIDPTASLNMTSNDLLVDYTGGTSPIATIQGWINTARNGGDWAGLGLTSTAAKNNPSLNTTLGVMEALDYKALVGNPNAAFDGETIDDTVVLIKYTYYGDANFSGDVNFDDYVRIDLGFNTALSGWNNGDFNGDGAVNFDDYVLIDVAFNTQSGVL